jgi:tRNA A37 methylthiotransferase MiaB
MVERSAAGGATRIRGRTASQAPEIDGVAMLRGEAEPGDFVRTRIERATTYDLHGRITGAVA